ncbi:MAG: pyridoxine 5'-phosphate oxidase C-terminal domain-containing protein [Gammaproteobacteria bacterium]
MYKIKPLQIEIWKEGEYRRHERTQFELKGKKWIKSFLSP